MNIVCIGSSSKDIFFPTDEGMVVETPEDITAQRKFFFELGAKYKIENRYEVPGGCAANVAQGLARLGVKSSCYSRIGDDELGRWIKSEIAKEGTDVRFVREEKNCISDLSVIIVDGKSGDRVIFSNQKANGGLKIIPEEIANFEWIFIGDLHGNWEKILDDIFSIAEKNGIKIAFNPRQSNIHDNIAKIREAIGRCGILVLNKDEAIEIVNEKQEMQNKKLLNDETYLLQELKKMGPDIAALTDGLRGAWAFGGDEIIHADSSNDKPIETTGAGDAFSSGFLAAIMKGKTIKEAILWGSANGGNVVNFFGAKGGLLKEAEIVEKIKNISVEIVK